MASRPLPGLFSLTAEPGEAGRTGQAIGVFMNREWSIIIVVGLVVTISAVADRSRTREGIRRGVLMLRNLLPQFLMLVVLVSVFLGLVSRETLADLLGQGSGAAGVLLAAGIGSVALIPGPIAFPLAGMLFQSGVGYPVLAVFITTLMMVGVVTFPVEKEYLGVRTAVLRNLLSLAGALIVGAVLGILL